MYGPIELHPLIIPTVLIPLTAVGVGLSVATTYIAGLFGVKLKAEGPKKALELLLKPKVLFSAVVFNLVGYGGWSGYQYIQNYPAFETTIQSKQKELAQPTDQIYSNQNDINPRNNNTKKLTRTDPWGELNTVWSTTLNPKEKVGSFEGAIVSGQSLFLGSDDGFVYEHEINTGKMIRKFFIGTKVTPQPIVHNGKLYVGEGVHANHHSRIYQFDLKTGDYLKAYQTLGHTEGKPFIAHSQKLNRDVLLLVGGHDGLHAVDAETLTPLWNVQQGHTDSGAIVQNGIVFSGTGIDKEPGRNSRSYANAYQLEDGKLLWRHEIMASSWMRPLAVGSMVCFVMGEVYFKSAIAGVGCFNQITGERIWTHQSENAVVSEAIEIDGDIVFSDSAGTVCRLNGSNGLAQWCKKTGDAKGKISFSGVTFDAKNQVILYPSLFDGIYVLDPVQGNLVKHYKLEPWGKTYANITLTEKGWVTADDNGLLRLLEPVRR
jgi:outer membrane protein assembly factor BamB